MGDGAVEVIRSRRGVQQGDSIGSFVFCCAVHPFIETLVRQAAEDGTAAPEVYCDDHYEFPRGSILDFRRQLERIETGYRERGLALQRAKLEFLPPPGHEVTEEERIFIEVQLGAKLAEGGMVVTGVPVGSTRFMEQQLEGALNLTLQPELCNLLRHLDNMACGDHAQAAMVINRLCVASRFIHRARGLADPEVFREKLGKKVDAWSLWLLERVSGLAGASKSFLEFREAPSIDNLVLSRHQQLQAFLPISEGGFGLTELNAAADTAYIGAMASSLRVVLSDEALPPGDHTERKLEALEGSSMERFRREGIAREIVRGGGEKVAAILPDGWVIDAATAGPFIERRDNEPAAERGRRLATILAGATSRSRIQGQLGALGLDDRVRARMTAVEELPVDEAEAITMRGETRQRAQARVMAMKDGISTLFLNATPGGEGHMDSTVFQNTVQRILGIRSLLGTTEAERSCPYHGERRRNGGARAIRTRQNRPDNFHVESCTAAGLLTTRHNFVVRGFLQCLDEAGVTGARVEVQDVFDGPVQPVDNNGNRSVLQMDVYLPSLSLVSPNTGTPNYKAQLIDVTVRSSMTKTAIDIHHSDRVTKAIVTAAENEKRQKYGQTHNPRTSTFIPFAVGTVGEIGEAAMRILNVVADHSARNEMSRERRSIVRGRTLARMKQIMSVAIATGASVSELRYGHNVKRATKEGVVIGGGTGGDERWGLRRHFAGRGRRQQRH
jgi:hypothetical protein